MKKSLIVKIWNLKKKCLKRKLFLLLIKKVELEKTTTVINLAAGLSVKNKKLLVIDLDPQGNATTGLGLSNVDGSEKNIYNVLNGNKTISEVIQKTKFDNLDIITSNVDLSGLEVELQVITEEPFILKDQLTSYWRFWNVLYTYSD